MTTTYDRVAALVHKVAVDHNPRVDTAAINFAIETAVYAVLNEPNTQQPLRAAPQPIAFRNGAYIYEVHQPTVLTRREHRRATYLQMLVDEFTCNEAESIAYWANLPVA